MRQTSYKRLLLLAALLLGVLPLRAQQNQDAPPASENIFTGLVRSAAGIPIPGATVKITSIETKKSWISWSDESGKFEFPGLPPGQYRAEASQLGFTASPSDITLPLVADAHFELTLRVMTLAELNAVSAPPGRGARNASASQNSNQGPGQNGFGRGRFGGPGGQYGANGQGPGQFGRGGFGGQNRQLPPGVTNAINEGLADAGAGFEQTDLTAEGGLDQDENPAANGPSGLTSSTDSFVMTGTVGQGAEIGGPPGPGGQFPALAGLPGGGPAFGNAVGGFGGLPGGNPAVQLGGGLGLGGPGGGPGGPGGPGGGPGGPAGAPGGAIRFGQGGPGGLFGGGGGRGRGGGGGGRGGGNVAFRRAVNRTRYSFFDQYQNSALDARPYSLTGVPAPVVGNYNERLGGDIGGPLKIPYIYDGSDRTFYFVNYTHQTSKNPIDTFATVPTAAERQGNFCGLNVQLFDPTSNISGPRTALPCQLPGSMLNSASLGLLQYIPLPNLPGTAQNYNLQTTTPTNSDAVNFHVVHTINAKFNVQGGYNFMSSRGTSLSSFADIGSHQSTRSQSVNLGFTQNFSSRFLQNLQLTWSRNRVQTLSFNSYLNNIAGALGITGIATVPIDYGIPEIGFTNFTGLNDPVPSLTRNQTLRFSDSLRYSLAKHTIQFGGEVRRLQFNTDTNPTARGSFTFTGLMTSQLTAAGTQVPGTGLDFADFLLGLPQSTYTRFGSSSQYLRSWMFIGYGQDDWRVNTKFSFEYGVRYEVTTPPISLINTLANLDVNSTFTAADVVTPGQTGPYQGLYPRSLIRADYNTWAPRVGFAWKPTEKGKTVLRGGYSIFYNEGIYNQLAAELSNQPPWAQAETRLTNATQVLTLQNGFPGEPVGDLLNTEAVSPNYKPGYAQIWTFGTETQLPGYWVVDATYTGTKGTNLDLLFAPNRPAPGSPLSTVLPIANAGDFTYDFSGANSIYNALQLRLLHRFTRGVMLQAVYTYSKSIDDASSIGGGSPTIVQNDDDIAAERGLSSFDMRQQLRFNTTYQLPFGERQRWFHHGLPEHLLGNLRVTSLVTFHTGIPYTAQVLSNSAGNSGTGTNFSTRANQVGNPSFGLCGGSTSAFFNTAAFATPVAGSYGDAARGTIEGPCAFTLNFSVSRSWRIGNERNRQFTARWDINNLTNTPTFSGLSTIVGSSTFGRISGAGSMRTMDLNLRVNF